MRLGVSVSIFSDPNTVHWARASRAAERLCADRGHAGGETIVLGE